MGILAREQCCSVMSRVKSRDAGQEMLVRLVVYTLGQRSRLLASKLPSGPDFVFESRKITLYLHAWFWQLRKSCRLSYFPKSSDDLWPWELSLDIDRDHKVTAALNSAGWNVAALRECERQPNGLCGHIGRLIKGAAK